jgi:hypothetical protein
MSNETFNSIFFAPAEFLERIKSNPLKNYLESLQKEEGEIPTAEIILEQNALN